MVPCWILIIIRHRIFLRFPSDPVIILGTLGDCWEGPFLDPSGGLGWVFSTDRQHTGLSLVILGSVYVLIIPKQSLNSFRTQSLHLKDMVGIPEMPWERESCNTLLIEAVDPL